MRFSGKLKTWNDERGFGFIEPDQGGAELFAHIKAFPDGTGRPAVGQVLTFEVELGPNGKKRARAIQYPLRRASRPPARYESPASWTPARVLAIPAFVGVYVYFLATAGFHPLPLIAYLILSALTFMTYAFDKSAARAGRWRTPENTLHVLSLAGGWPGALLAQQLLRHKTSKHGFARVFWATVVINFGAFVYWQWRLQSQFFSH